MQDLRPAANESEWQSIQDVIEAAFYTSRGKTGYDRQSPLDKEKNRHLLGFWNHEEVVGAVRIDLQEGLAVLRKFAIAPEFQHRGFGRLMIKAAEKFIVGNGYNLVVLGSEPNNVEFFKKAGYEVGAWPRSPQDTLTQPTIDMRKTLKL